MTRPPRIPKLRVTLRVLRRSTKGLALIEFAYGLPVLLGIGLGGVEIANLAVTRMRVSQLGMMVADNMARVGASNGLALKKVYESDIEDIFAAAKIQGTPFQLPDPGTNYRFDVATEHSWRTMDRLAALLRFENMAIDLW